MEEISQSMLKWSSDEEIESFTNSVLALIKPKFESESELELAQALIYGFAKNCELTAKEFIYALELAADGKLSSEPNESGISEKIKLFREIDRLKLGEVKAAYIYHKTTDKQYESGKNKIREFLNPPPPEPTEEEMKENRLKHYRTEWHRLQEKGEILGTPVFYDLIKKSGLQNVKLETVENILRKYNPTPKRVRENGQSFKINFQVDNAKTFFADEIVKLHIEIKKLAQLSENDWVDYWNGIYEK